MIEQILIENEEQWLNLRRQDLTASQVGALFGVHPWKTAAGVYAEKLGLETTSAQTGPMSRGKKLEQIAANEVQEKHPDWQIKKCRHYFRDSQKRIGGTPDFEVLASGRLGILETKTTFPRRFKHEWAQGPEKYALLQTLQNMYLTGAEFGIIGCLVVGDVVFEMHEFEVPRHEELLQTIFEKVESFWRHVDHRDPIGLDYGRDADTVRKLYPTTKKDSVIDLSHDNRIGELLLARRRLKGFIGESTEELKEIETEIRDKMGSAERGLVDDWDLTLKTTNNPGYKVEPYSYRQLRAKKLSRDPDEPEEND